MSWGLLLDFDGTMVDTESTVLQAWREEYEHHGLQLDDARWQQTLGTDSDRYAELASLVGAGFDLPNCQARKRRREAALVADLSLRPGIQECIEAAQRHGLRLAVVSGSPSTWVQPHIERLGLLNKLDVVVTREHADRPKPHPDLYLQALKALGLSANEAIAVEDSRNGVVAARSAGIRCIAYPNAVTRQHDLSLASRVVSCDIWSKVRRLLTAA